MKNRNPSNKLRAITTIICAGLLLGCWLSPICRAAEPTETKEQHDARMAWWREARFGLFIHWGLYAVPAGEWNGKTNYGEWILQGAKIPVSRYGQFAREFNPVQFDAKSWVGAAKAAGMKYIVITSKHHDGFGMWPSELTDWNIKSTPFGRDPLQELSAECRKTGLKFCVYYSIRDWHHPDWAPRLAWNDTATGTPDMDRYVAYMKGQLKELVTRYHPAALWFDGDGDPTWTHERGLDLWNYLRALDPVLIINNRIAKARSGMAGKSANASTVGDFGTPEQQIPPAGFGAGVDWESCMTMNHHWGYNKTDHDWKSAEVLIRNLCDIASKGGNYLLNVGPDRDGLIPQASLERLAKIGSWMKINGEAIYGTGPTPFGPEAGKFSDTEKTKKGEPKFMPSWEWRATTKPGKIYLIIFKWPATGRFELPPVVGKVIGAALLEGEGEVTFSQTGQGVTLSLPAAAPDAVASVVCLNLEP
ncbi:MAG: alpha-L-fucosidase [bacterium]|nr:alpha-L-fucosidase [bacterium]